MNPPLAQRLSALFWLLVTMASSSFMAASYQAQAAPSPGTIYAIADLQHLDIVGDEGWVTLRIRDYTHGPAVWGASLDIICSSNLEFVPESFAFNPSPDPWLPTEGVVIQQLQPSAREGGTMTWLIVPDPGYEAGATNGALARFRLRRIAGGHATMRLATALSSTCARQGALLGLCVPSPGPLYRPELIGLEIPEAPKLTMTGAGVIGDSLRLSWADTTPPCILEESTDQMQWMPSSLGVNTEHGTNSVTVPTIEPKGFLRLRCP